MAVKEASIRDFPDYYLGWVIQPLSWDEDAFYVYPPDDTRRQKGFLIHGSKEEAMSFIDNRSKFS